MPEIHPSAILEGEVELAGDVVVGPHCVLTGPVTLGAGTRLIGGVWLQGPLVMGERNVVYPGACLGFAGQDLKWDPREPGAGVVIGDDNVFREGSTVHRATSHETPTRIGSRGMWMAQAHAGHDTLVGDDCVFANSTALGGHSRVDDRVITGGGLMVHQFCRIGRGTMLSGGVATSRDLPPFFMLTGINVAGSLNLVGMRRMGMSREEIDDVRWVYRTLYRQGHSLTSAVAELETRRERPLVAEYLDFLATSKRGICTGAGDAKRGNFSAVDR